MNPERILAWLKTEVGIASLLFVGAFFLAFLFINQGLFHYDAVTLARAVDTTY